MISKPTQDFVPLEEIRDGVIVMKDGTLCSILLATSVNLSLKSYEEQQATILQFQNFLNSLDFSVQICIQSRRYDVRPYIVTLENRLKEQEEQLLRIQTTEYIEFIRTFTEQVNIMRKSFFLVIPYSPSVIVNKKGFLGFLQPKKKNSNEPLEGFEEQRTQLEQRAGVVEQGLSRLGIKTAQLGTQEIIELFYKTFNPGETSSQAKNI